MDPKYKIVNITGIRHQSLFLAYRLLMGADFPKAHFSFFKSETEENFRKTYHAGFLVGSIKILNASDESLRGSISEILAKIQSERGQVRRAAEPFHKAGKHFITCNQSDWWGLGEFLLKLPRTHPLFSLVQHKISALADATEYDETIYVRFDANMLRKVFETAKDAKVSKDELIFLDRIVTICDEQAAKIRRCSIIQVSYDDNPLIIRQKIADVLSSKGII